MFRNDEEAARLRIASLEAELEERRASLAARDAQLAERDAELARLRRSSAARTALGAARTPLFTLLLGVAVGAGLGLSLVGSRSGTTARSTPTPPPVPVVDPASAPLPEPRPADRAVDGVEPTPTPGASAREFDRAEVVRATGEARARARACVAPGEPPGSGRVRITFSPTGRVSSAVVEGAAFDGKPAAECAARAFRSVRVPPFDGASVSVRLAIPVP